MISKAKAAGSSPEQYERDAERENSDIKRIVADIFTFVSPLASKEHLFTETEVGVWVFQRLPRHSEAREESGL
jgi:hypothetical protein